MDNSFFAAFNSSNAEAEKVMGEWWKLLVSASDVNGVAYSSIAIERLSASDRATFGGRFSDVSTTIQIRKCVEKASGVKESSLVMARGEMLRVRTIERDGDDSVTLLCGPASLSMK